MRDINFKGHVSVDCVTIRYYNNELQVLIDESKFSMKVMGEEKIRHHAIVTHLTDSHESINQLIKNKLNAIGYCETAYVEQFRTFASTCLSNNKKDRNWFLHLGREINKPVVIIGAFALTVSKEENLVNESLRWIPISQVGELVPIHNQLIEETLMTLRNRIAYEPIVFHLLPNKFSLNDLQQVYEIILGINLDKRNFRKKISHLKYLVPLDEKQKNVRHKPARLYCFDRSIYDNNQKLYLGL